MTGPQGWTAQKTLLRGFLDQVWSNGDLSAVTQQIAEQYTIHHDPSDPWNGLTLDRDGFCNRVRTSRAAVPDQVFEIHDMVEEADRIAVAWHWSGTHLGDLPDFPRSGASLQMSGLTLYSFNDGLISGHWQIADRLSIYQQLLAAGQRIPPD